LTFYGLLKGLTGKALKVAVDASLRSVKLKFAGDRWSTGYSGGMKRRLSVANALIGQPDVVYLDEPSTGLDPAAKHNLWDIINECKGDKSLLLTTHSMEEADALCDRMGIMTHGNLACIGSAPQLKQRYGAGYTCMLTTSGGNDAVSAIADFVSQTFPHAKLLQEPIAGTSKYEVSSSDVEAHGGLSAVLATLQGQQKSLQITDWGMTETTLEEVFLKIVQDEEAKEAAGRSPQPAPLEVGEP